MFVLSRSAAKVGCVRRCGLKWKKEGKPEMGMDYVPPLPVAVEASDPAAKKKKSRSKAGLGQYSLGQPNALQISTAAGYDPNPQDASALLRVLDVVIVFRREEGEKLSKPRQIPYHGVTSLGVTSLRLSLLSNFDRAIAPQRWHWLFAEAPSVA